MNSVHKISVIFALTLGTIVTGVSNAEAAPTIRSSAMNSALTQKGARYVYGATGGYSKGYDCSGLVYWAYKKHGKTLPRTAQSQYNSSKHIAYKDRKPGDLVFIRDSRGHVYHTGIYIGVKYGRSYMVNANTGSYRGRKVVEAPVYEYGSGSRVVYGRY